MLGHEEGPDGEGGQDGAPEKPLRCFVEAPVFDKGVQSEESPQREAPFDRGQGEREPEDVLRLQEIEFVLVLAFLISFVCHNLITACIR